MKAISVILAVDRNHRNLELLSQFWEREGYQTRPAATLEVRPSAGGGQRYWAGAGRHRRLRPCDLGAL